MGTRDVSQCFECGVVGEGEVDIDNGLFYCYACWLIYHAARARLRRDTAHVQTARTFQGVSSAPGSAQHEQSVQDVSFASGRRPQLRRLGTCKCAAWAQRAGCILCTWTWARLAAGHANLRAYTPRGRGSTRHGASTMRCGVTACGRGGAVALDTPRETWPSR